MSIQLSDAERARIAHEVSERYGVMCRPDVVQRIEQGQTTTPEYVWDGRSQLVPVVAKAQGEPLRRNIDAKWKSLARRNRLEEAKRREAGPVDPAPPVSRAPKRPNNAAALARLREIAEVRAGEIRAFASGGATLRQIAAKMDISEAYARKYCDKWQIEPAPQARKENAEVIARRDRVRDLAKSGMRAKEIAAAVGISERNVWNDLRVLGLNLKREPVPKPQKVPDTRRQDAVAARRVLVADCLANGITESRAIAAALNVTMRCVQLDLRAIQGPRVMVKKPRSTRADLADKKVPNYGRQNAVAARRALVSDCLAKGITETRAIAQALNVTLRCVQCDLRAIQGPRNVVKKDRPTRADLAADKVRRTEAIRRLRAEGLTYPKIASAVGCSLPTVAYTLSDLGMTDKTRIKGHVGNEETVRRVMALHANGYSCRRIAAEVGIGSGTAHRIIETNKKQGGRDAA